MHKSLLLLLPLKHLSVPAVHLYNWIEILQKSDCFYAIAMCFVGLGMVKTLDLLNGLKCILNIEMVEDLRSNI